MKNDHLPDGKKTPPADPITKAERLLFALNDVDDELLLDAMPKDAQSAPAGRKAEGPVKESAGSPSTNRRPFWRRFSGVAAAGLVLAALGAFLMTRDGPESGEVPTAASEAAAGAATMAAASETAAESRPETLAEPSGEQTLPESRPEDEAVTKGPAAGTTRAQTEEMLPENADLSLPDGGFVLDGRPQTCYVPATAAACRRYALPGAEETAFDPAALVLSQDDLGPVLGTVTQSADPALCGCTVCHHSLLPDTDGLVILCGPDGRLALYCAADAAEP